MAQATRLYFENNLDIPLHLILVATETDLELHIYDYEVEDAVCIPAQKTAAHPVTPAIKRFITESEGDDSSVRLGMDYWIMPHLRTIGAISLNDTSRKEGRVNQEDGPVFSFYPVTH